MQLIMCSVQLLGCCYAVANGFYHIAIWLLKCCGYCQVTIAMQLLRKVKLCNLIKMNKK